MYSYAGVWAFTQSTLAEDAQVKFQHLTHPDGAVPVIGQMVTGFGVGEDSQALPVHDQPGEDLIENLGGKVQLAAPTGVRPDIAYVHPAHSDGRKQAHGLFADLLGRALRVGVEIDMGVVAVDLGHGASVTRVSSG